MKKIHNIFLAVLSFFDLIYKFRYSTRDISISHSILLIARGMDTVSR